MWPDHLGGGANARFNDHPLHRHQLNSTYNRVLHSLKLTECALKHWHCLEPTKAPVSQQSFCLCICICICICCMLRDAGRMILVSPEAAGIIHHQRPISSCHVWSSLSLSSPSSPSSSSSLSYSPHWHLLRCMFTKKKYRHKRRSKGNTNTTKTFRSLALYEKQHTLSNITLPTLSWCFFFEMPTKMSATRARNINFRCLKYKYRNKAVGTEQQQHVVWTVDKLVVSASITTHTRGGQYRLAVV